MGISEGIFRNFKTTNKKSRAKNLAEMCKERGFILVVSNKEGTVKQITKEDLEELRSIQEPFYLDNAALISLLQSWEDEERAHYLLLVEHEELVKRKNFLFDEFLKSSLRADDLETKNTLLQYKIEKLEELVKRTLLDKLLAFFRSKP